MNPPIEYVLGFLFNGDQNAVVLILKKRPEWQLNKLNGIGGKMLMNEAGTKVIESPREAMVREFKEETGVDTSTLNWLQFCELSGDTFKVYCFNACNQRLFDEAKTMEDEHIEKWPIDSLHKGHCVGNLTWLLHLALDTDSHYVTARYSHPYTFKSVQEIAHNAGLLHAAKIVEDMIPVASSHQGMLVREIIEASNKST